MQHRIVEIGGVGAPSHDDIRRSRTALAHLAHRVVISTGDDTDLGTRLVFADDFEEKFAQSADTERPDDGPWRKIGWKMAQRGSRLKSTEGEYGVL